MATSPDVRSPKSGTRSPRSSKVAKAPTSPRSPKSTQSPPTSSLSPPIRSPPAIVVEELHREQKNDEWKVKVGCLVVVVTVAAVLVIVVSRIYSSRAEPRRPPPSSRTAGSDDLSKTTALSHSLWRQDAPRLLPLLKPPRAEGAWELNQ